MDEFFRGWRRKIGVVTLVMACVLMIGLLCVPERKWGNHTYVAFPLLASLAGVAAGSILDKAKATHIAIILAAASVVAWALSLSGVLARALPPPCPFSTTLASALEVVKPGDPILVVAPEVDSLAVVELAAERKLSPFPVSRLPENSPIGTAVVRDGIEIPASWTRIAQGNGWSLVRANRR